LELVLEKIPYFFQRTGLGPVRRGKKESRPGSQRKIRNHLLTEIFLEFFFPGKLGTAGSSFFCEHEKKHKQTSCVCSKMQTPPNVNSRPGSSTLGQVERFSWTDPLFLTHLFHVDLKTHLFLTHLTHVDLETRFYLFHLTHLCQLDPTCPFGCTT